MDTPNLLEVVNGVTGERRLVVQAEYVLLKEKLNEYDQAARHWHRLYHEVVMECDQLRERLRREGEDV